MIPVVVLPQLIPSQSSTTAGANLITGNDAFAYIGRDILLGSTNGTTIIAGVNTTVVVQGEVVGQAAVVMQADSDISIGITASRR